MNKPLRFGIFSGGTDEDGTADIELMQIGKWLANRGNEIVVFTRESATNLHEAAKKKSLDVKSVKTSGLVYDFNAALKLRKSLKEKKIKMLIFRNPTESSLMVATKFLMKGKLRLIYIQSGPLKDMESDYVKVFGLNNIDAWISPLSALANEVRTLTNLPVKKIHVIQFPIRLKKILGKAKGSKAADDGNSDEGELVISLQRQYSDEVSQDLDCLLHAVSNLGNSKSRVKLLIASAPNHSKGKGLENQALIARIKDLDLDRNYEYVDKADLRSLFSKTDLVFLLPDTEPFDGLGIKALTAGLPCIAPNTLTTSEMLNFGEFGILFNRYNHADLSMELERILTHPQRLDQYRDVVSDIMRHEAKQEQFCQKLEQIAEALPKRARN